MASRGRDTAAMLREPRKAYLIFGAEPELDVLDSGPARRAMDAAEFIAMITSFKPSPYESGAVEYADVLLPLAAFTETDGSFINAEGRSQRFAPAVAPQTSAAGSDPDGEVGAAGVDPPHATLAAAIAPTHAVLSLIASPRPL